MRCRGHWAAARQWPEMMREAQLTALRQRPVAEMWMVEWPGRGLIGVADLGRRQ